jgi:hypothetical protein
LEGGNTITLDYPVSPYEAVLQETCLAEDDFSARWAISRAMP